MKVTSLLDWLKTQGNKSEKNKRIQDTANMETQGNKIENNNRIGKERSTEFIDGRCKMINNNNTYLRDYFNF